MNQTLEPIRYLNNAKDILSNHAKKEDGYYQDKKYIKLAGHAAYSGVLVALDEAFNIPKKGRVSVDWYRQEIIKHDKKILNYFNEVYEQLHLVMGYDCFGKEKTIKEVFEVAEKIIEWTQEKVKFNTN